MIVWEDNEMRWRLDWIAYRPRSDAGVDDDIARRCDRRSWYVVSEAEIQGV